jgi:hypothetical protein
MQMSRANAERGGQYHRTVSGDLKARERRRKFFFPL